MSVELVFTSKKYYYFLFLYYIYIFYRNEEGVIYVTYIGLLVWKKNTF